MVKWPYLKITTAPDSNRFPIQSNSMEKPYKILVSSLIHTYNSISQWNKPVFENSILSNFKIL